MVCNSYFNQFCAYILLSRLIAQYQKHAKRLQVTGRGIGDDDDNDDDSQNGPDQFMEFYIVASGPDESTSDHAM
jgi:hypothetical protein